MVMVGENVFVLLVMVDFETESKSRWGHFD